MLTGCQENLPRTRPDPYTVVLATGNRQPAVARESDVPNLIAMAFEGADLFAIVCIPQADDTVGPRGQNPPTVRRYRDGLNVAGRTVKGLNRFAGVEVPKAQ